MNILKNNFQGSSYYKFLQREGEEIRKLKWIESEKKGFDIGTSKAIILWSTKYRKNWVDNN
jgi:hypothetical protein